MNDVYNCSNYRSITGKTKQDVTDLQHPDKVGKLRCTIYYNDIKNGGRRVQYSREINKVFLSLHNKEFIVTECGVHCCTLMARWCVLTTL